MHDKPSSVAFLHFAGPIFNQISRVLVRHNIKWADQSHKRISSFLRPGKDNLGFRTLGVHRNPCECGKVYIKQTGRSVDTRLKELQRNIRLEHPDKSAVAEHCVDSGHRIPFHDTAIFATKTRYMDRIVREATETELHPNNMNRCWFCFSFTGDRLGSHYVGLH
jgi:hypothetical protein